MHDELVELVKKYTIKHDRKIKKICEPLQIYLGISYFGYYVIENDGNFIDLSNYPEALDFFYSSQLHLTSPLLTHPRFYRSGTALVLLTQEKKYSELILEKFYVNHSILHLQNRGNRIEGFFFANKYCNAEDYTYLLTQLDLLRKFGEYFKREAGWLINQALNEGFSIALAKKERFFLKPASGPLSSENKNVERFLNKILGLSPQEQRCVELFRQGRSAQATAAILGLSRRTVEHYFDNIKKKLNYHSKWELLNL